MQWITFHTTLALLPYAGDKHTLITFYELALNFSINSSISFPGICSCKLPSLFQSLGKKLIRLKLRFFNYTPTCKTRTCLYDFSFQNTKLTTLSENIYIPNTTAKAKYVENIERATDRKISLSPKLKALRLTFHKHYCLMSNAIYHMMTFIWKQMWIWIILH